MSNTDGSNLVSDITPLALSDNFYTWFTRTNLLIDAINPLNIYDITPRKGLTESRSGGNVIIDVDTGKGLKAYPNDATGKLTLDFESLTASASVANDDLFVIETPTTGVSNDVYKISASAMLPPTLTGNHAFTGTITASVLNVNDNVIRLQYGDTITENDAGLILDTTTSSKVKFTYDLARAAWFSNRNIGLETGYSFLTNSNNRRGDFKFSTHGSNQYDVGLELLMGQQITQGDDHSWLIEARNVDRALNFIYKTYVNTDVENRIFYAQIDTLSPVTSTFVISDKIQIGNVAGSTTNFKSVTDYSSSIIPISNSNGILDSKWTNRYVSSAYSSGLEVGDIVKIYNDTNNQATIVKCALTSVSDDSEAYSLGIVERISGGKVWVVTHGEFVLSNIPGSYSNLDVGAVYYLTNGSPNYTLTKPATGIVKPVFVATSTTGGVIFPMNTQGLSFGRVGVVNAAGGTVITATGTTVTSDAPNDIFTLDAGSGISLETDTSNNKIIIRASTLGNQPTYSSISTNSGTVNAYRPSETLSLIGSGGVEVTATDIASTNGDQITIRGKYFRTISWSGDSSTNDISGSYTAASYDDTFNIYTGVGIGISPHPTGNGFRIDATGSAISSIAVNSQDLNIFKVSAGNSILGYFGGATTFPVSALNTANNTLLSANSSGAISWATPTTILQEKFASSTAAFGSFYGATSTRNFGILVLSNDTFNSFTSFTTFSSANVASFRYSATAGVNNAGLQSAIIALKEGDGIRLETQNGSGEGEPVSIIKISNKNPIGFNKVYIEDTGETVEASPSQTKYYNLFKSSTNLCDPTNGSAWYVFTPSANSGVASAAKNTLFGGTSPGKTPHTSITFSANGLTSTNGTLVEFGASGGTNGLFCGLYKTPGTAWSAEELNGKVLTVSVYAAVIGGSSQTFQFGYYGGRIAGMNAAGVTHSGNRTVATGIPQRFTWSIVVASNTTASASPASSFPIPPHFSLTSSTSAADQNIVFWGAQAEISSSANPLLVTTNEPINYNILTNSVLRMSTVGSPILLDSDTNSDTIYFNIATNSITNSYLATMADNTVKVGTGSTNANNTPQDLAIAANSVLGRVGNGDLKSVNMSELASMIGTNYFTSVQTDSGTVTPSETTTLRLKGGTGIIVTEGTNHDVIITSTGSSGGGSIGFVGAKDTLGNEVGQSGAFTSLIFQDGEFKNSVTASTDKAIVTSSINWSNLTSSTNAGAGFLYGKGSGSNNTDRASITTSFEPIGNLAYDPGISKSFIPVIDGSTDTLSYVKRAASQTDTIDRVLGFKSDGTLVATTSMGFSDISYSGISGLTTTISGGTATITAGTGTTGVGQLVSIPWLQTGIQFTQTGSTYAYSGFVTKQKNAFLTYENGTGDTDTGTNSTPQYIFSVKYDPATLTFNTATLATILLATKLNSSSNFTNFTRQFDSQMKFMYIKNWSGFSTGGSVLSLDKVLIGPGPQSNNTSSRGMVISNSSGNGPGLIFTNFSSNNTTATTEKDRSCRIGLQILNADAPVSNSYNTVKNTAYITHTYVPASSSIVDSFTVSASTKNSYKYLVHAQNTSGEFYTTELLIQINGTTANILQYASSTTSSSLTVSFSVAVEGTTATVSHNYIAPLDIKLIKYEV
jgi:hypothetical protein